MRRRVATDARARQVLYDVDRNHASYLANSFATSGDVPGVDSATIAELEYAIYVGHQHVSPDIAPERTEYLFEALARLTHQTAH